VVRSLGETAVDENAPVEVDEGKGLAVSAFLDDTDDLEGVRFVRIAMPGGRDEVLVMEGDTQR